MSEPTILLVEDDQAVRHSLSWMLRQAGYQVKAFPSPGSLLSEYDPKLPGCLVLDLQLPQMNGIELHEKLVECGGTHPFIIITGHGEVPDATQAMRLGAVDFIQKPLDRKVFLDRVRQAVDADRRQRCGRAKQELFQARLDSLTPRERQVLELVIDGKLTKQIANQLGIAIKTVEVHRSNITRKMHVESVVQLVRLCTEQQATPADAPQPQASGCQRVPRSPFAGASG